MNIENDNGKYSLVAWGDSAAYLEINYCPICGRRLNND
jgi:hypothetical protein